MPGLVPCIHVFLCCAKTWMAGSSPAMTKKFRGPTMTEIRVPTLGESVTEATIGKWFKKPGDPVAVDEPLVELETDKGTAEAPAPPAAHAGRHLSERRRDGRGRRTARQHQRRSGRACEGRIC